MKRNFSLILGIVSLLLSGLAKAESYALLITVGDYQHGTGALQIAQGGSSNLFRDLDGPIEDAVSMRAFVESELGIDPANVIVLAENQATREGIIAGLEEIESRLNPGDFLFFYFSGHGTSAKHIDKTTGKPLFNMPDGTGAMVPWDFKPKGAQGEKLSAEELSAQLIIGRRDIRPVFERLDQQEVRIWAVVDACYSGNAVRSAYREKTRQSRNVTLQPKGSTRSAKNVTMCHDCAREDLGVYPYKNVVFFSASSDGEEALDLDSLQTADGKPHGALTDAMLRAASAAPLQEQSYNDYYEHISEIVEHCCQQSPILLPDALSESVEIVDKLISVVPATEGTNTEDTNHSQTGGQALEPQSELEALLAACSDCFKPGSPLEISVATQLRGKIETALAEFITTDQILLSDDRPNLIFKLVSGDLVILDSAEDLIIRFDGVPASEVLVQWISRQIWYAEQRRLEQQKAFSRRFVEQYNSVLVLKDGLHGKSAMEGSKVYFTTKLGSSRSLVLLVLSSRGKMSFLYPYDKQEARPIPAGQQFRFPKDNLIDIEAPFGTDRVLLFGLEEGDKSANMLKQIIEITKSENPYVMPETPVLQNLLASVANGNTVLRTLSVKTYADIR